MSDQNDTRNSNSRPETLRDGMLKASIFRNEHESGTFFNTVFSKLYQDADGELRETHSFASDDLLHVGELAREAHNRIRALRREDQREPDREKSREEYTRQRQPRSNRTRSNRDR